MAQPVFILLSVVRCAGGGGDDASDIRLSKARDKKSLPARTHTRHDAHTHIEPYTHKCSMTNEEDTIQVPAHLYLFVFSIL